jgi:hypothetical protein
LAKTRKTCVRSNGAEPSGKLSHNSPSTLYGGDLFE